MKKSIDILRHLIDNGHNQLYDRITSSYDKYVAITKKQILDYLGGKPVDIKELKLLLAHKADKTTTLEQLDQKVDIKNYIDNMNKITSLYEKIGIFSIIHAL